MPFLYLAITIAWMMGARSELYVQHQSVSCITVVSRTLFDPPTASTNEESGNNLASRTKMLATLKSDQENVLRRKWNPKANPETEVKALLGRYLFDALDLADNNGKLNNLTDLLNIDVYLHALAWPLNVFTFSPRLIEKPGLDEFFEDRIPIGMPGSKYHFLPTLFLPRELVTRTRYGLVNFSVFMRNIKDFPLNEPQVKKFYQSLASETELIFDSYNTLARALLHTDNSEREAGINALKKIELYEPIPLIPRKEIEPDPEALEMMPAAPRILADPKEFQNLAIEFGFRREDAETLWHFHLQELQKIYAPFHIRELEGQTVFNIREDFDELWQNAQVLLVEINLALERDASNTPQIK